MDALAGPEQLMYGESAASEIEMFIVIFTPEMVASADGRRKQLNSGIQDCYCPVGGVQ